MAILFPPGLRLADSDGNPLSGAKVRVYDANTTTLSDLFSDTALSVAISNPVVTDAAGYPANGGNECVINVADGAYDVALLTSADAVFANWDDVSPWGSGSGDVSYTLTGDGRLKFTGSAGTVKIQAGSPSPDEVGGDLTIEGQAGTQLDALTLDSASVNAGTSTGALKENSKKIAGVVHTEATTFTAVASVDIELVNLPTGCRAWDVELFDVICSNTPILMQLRISYDSGGTYKSGATDYTWSGLAYDSPTNTYVVTGSSGSNDMSLSNTTTTNTANRPGRIKLSILTPDSGAYPTAIEISSMLWNSDANPVRDVIAGMGLGGYGRATHIRVFPSAGTFAGKYLVRPQRGYGEA